MVALQNGQVEWAAFRIHRINCITYISHWEVVNKFDRYWLCVYNVGE